MKSFPSLHACYYGTFIMGLHTQKQMHSADIYRDAETTNMSCIVYVSCSVLLVLSVVIVCWHVRLRATVVRWSRTDASTPMHIACSRVTWLARYATQKKTANSHWNVNMCSAPHVIYLILFAYCSFTAICCCVLTCTLCSLCTLLCTYLPTCSAPRHDPHRYHHGLVINRKSCT